jgi:hypothetical protein
MNSIQRAHQIGQAIWLDYIRRSLLNSGEFGEYVEKGISGVTSNPTIFEKAIIGSTDYDDTLLQLAHTSLLTSEIYEHLATKDISNAAQQLRLTYEQTGGIHGYVSIEVCPLLAHDTEGTNREARRLIKAISLPNVMIKVPATTEGLPAIRKLIGELIKADEVPRPRIELGTRGFSVRIELGTRGFSVHHEQTLLDILTHLVALGQAAEQLRQALGSNSHRQDQVVRYIQQLSEGGEHVP